MKKRTGALLLALVLLLGCAGCAADGGDPVLRAAGDAAEYLLALQEPAHGGEWLAVCLGSGVLDPPSGWLEDYLESMAEYAAGCDGVLSPAAEHGVLSGGAGSYRRRRGCQGRRRLGSDTAAAGL